MFDILLIYILYRSVLRHNNFCSARKGRLTGGSSYLSAISTLLHALFGCTTLIRRCNCIGFKKVKFQNSIAAYFEYQHFAHLTLGDSMLFYTGHSSIQSCTFNERFDCGKVWSSNLELSILEEWKVTELSAGSLQMKKEFPSIEKEQILW